MKNPILYLAYGSNANPARMMRRCPGAVAVGSARLPNYKLTERLYADIDFCESASVYGVLYLISYANLRALDAYEGYPKVYRRYMAEVDFNGERYSALVYEMTNETKAAREGMPYPEEYRQICSDGMRYYRVPNKFTKKRKVTK